RSFIELTNGDGIHVALRQTPGRALLFVDASNGTDVEPLQGFAGASIYHAGAIQEVLLDVDSNGHPIAHIQMGSGANPIEIFSVDLLEQVGGEAVTGSLVTWTSSVFAGFERYVAGLSTSGDLLLWRVQPDGISWSFVNLTEAMDGARPIA